MMSLNAIVVRDGKEVEVAADQLVPGDVVRLSLGDKVPAGKSSFLFLATHCFCSVQLIYVFVDLTIQT